MKIKFIATVIGVLGMALAVQAGDVTGKVTLKGAPPPEVPIKMEADANCAALHAGGIKTSRFVVGANGELANVFVYVKEGAQPSAAPAQAVVLDQKGCLYFPMVVGVQVGQELEIMNSDATLHNVHALPDPAKGNKEFNFAQPTQGQKNKKKFDKPEVMVKFKCDVHPWMFAYVGVVPHPFFAVTGADGSFSLKGLPAGEYTIEAWHVKGGTQTAKVKVADGAATANFVFEAPVAK